MKFKKTTPYNIHNKFKGWISTLLIAGMPLVSCGEDNPIDPVPPQPQPPVIRDVTISFNRYNYESIFVPSKLQHYVKDESVQNVFFVTEGSWKALRAQAISTANANYFKPVFAMSPKFKGKGHFDFHSGEPTKALADSLDYVKYGFTLGGEQR